MPKIERATLLLSPSAEARLDGFGSAIRDSTRAASVGIPKAHGVVPRERGYCPGLTTSALVAEIRGLLSTVRRAECLLCRYLGDLADRVQSRQDVELHAYADELEAARHFFGLGARETRERVRVGRALRKLPEIERAFIDGELCYSRVREVTRVATVLSESDWLELARRLDMRALERRVGAERAATNEKPIQHGERSVGERARERWMSGGRVRVTFELSVETWAVLERAMLEARRAGTCGPGDGEALEAVARAALSVHADPSDEGALEGIARAALSVRPGDSTDAGVGALPDAWPTSDERAGDGGESKFGQCTRDRSQFREAIRGWTLSELGTETTQCGSAERMAVPDGATPVHGAEATQHELVEHAAGARDDGIDEERSQSDFVDQASKPAVRLLQVMGRSPGWTLEALTQSSGLSVQQTCLGLTLLELGGRVRRRAFAFDPQ